MRRGLALALFVALALAASPAPAEDSPGPQVSVEVEKHPALNQTIRLTYVFRGPGTGSVRVPPVLPLKNLAIVGGPATSTQITFINGDLSRTVSLTYYLRARATGAAEVGEVHFSLGDKVLKAPGQTLEVEAARSGGPGVVGASDESDEDPLAPFRPRMEVRPSRRPAVVEYLATPEKTTAYVGEEIAITYDLLTDADVEGLEYVDAPKFPGCWAEDLDKPEKPVGRREVVDGRAVTRFTLLKKAVAGLAPGTVSLPPARIRLAVRSSGDPFADPFAFFQRQVVERETKPIALKVQPIPGDAKFKGPVGRFDLTAKVDHDRVSAGDALTVKVRLAGVGNLRNAQPEAPRLEVPNARVYPPTAKSDPAKGRPGGSVEWSYVVVPSARGALTIPPTSVAVFDPAEKRIVTKTTEPITIAVEGGAAPPRAEAVASSGSKEPSTAPAASTSGTADTLDAEQVAAQFTPKPNAPAKNGPSAPGSVDMAHGTVTLPLWAVAAVPAALLLLGGSAVAAKARAKKAVDVRGAIAPEPNETKERAAARIDRAVRDWLSSRHGIPDGLSAVSVDAALAEKSVASDVREDLVALLSELEFLRFAPQLGDYTAKISEVRGRAARLLPRLK